MRETVSTVSGYPELHMLIEGEKILVGHRRVHSVVNPATGAPLGALPLADAADQRGVAHYGLVLVDPAKYPRGAQRTIGRMVRALDRLLGEHPTDKSAGARHWL